MDYIKSLEAYQDIQESAVTLGKFDGLHRGHQKLINKIIEFFGNNALLNIFEDIKKEVPKSKFNINDYTYESLVKDLKEKELSKNIVFVFDNSLKLSNKEYENLIQICREKNIFVINFNKDLNNLDGVNFVDFSKNLDDYLMADKIHLSDKGNEELIKIIIENLT